MTVGQPTTYKLTTLKPFPAKRIFGFLSLFFGFPCLSSWLLAFFLCLAKCKALKADANICNKFIGLQQRRQCAALDGIAKHFSVEEPTPREKALLHPAALFKNKKSAHIKRPKMVPWGRRFAPQVIALSRWSILKFLGTRSIFALWGFFLRKPPKRQHHVFVARAGVKMVG